GLALAGTGQLLYQRTKVRRLELLKAARTILGGVAPQVRTGADKGAHGLAIAEIDPLHGDDLVDDRRQFASGFRPFDLWLPRRDVELVSVLFKHGHEDDGAFTCML